MDKEKKPKVEEFRVDAEELAQLKASLAASDFPQKELLLTYLGMLSKLANLLMGKRIRINRLRNLLFGKKTEKTPPGPPGSSGNDLGSGGGGGVDESGRQGEEQGGQRGEGDSTHLSAEARNEAETLKQGKGHGRHPARAYEGVKTTYCPLCGPCIGDRCPLCGRGTIYRHETSVLLKIQGNPPLVGERIEREAGRCSGCGAIFYGELPARVNEERYEPSALSMLVLSKYGLGVPWSRLERWQKELGVPVAASTQWDLTERVADQVLPVWQFLRRLAARAELIFIDDSWYLIKDEKKRTVITAVVAKWEDHWIVLYLPGEEAAGGKLEELLQERPGGLPKPLRMSDALNGNGLDSETVIVLLCWVHARRHLYEIKDFYPETCLPVLEAIGKLYHHESLTRQQGLEGAARLIYHQQHSLPLLEQIHRSLEEDFQQKRIEPNSSLGQAVKYLLKHWPQLLNCFQHEGAPLDNNLAERILKYLILGRKNSLFFKTRHGAEVGCLLLSLLATVLQNRGNPFVYLKTLLEQRDRLRPETARFLPWNFEPSRAGP